MNRIYKVIWNEALNCFTAVGEYAKARGKSSKSSVSSNTAINTTSNLSTIKTLRLSAIGLGLLAAGFGMQTNAMGTENHHDGDYTHSHGSHGVHAHTSGNNSHNNNSDQDNPEGSITLNFEGDNPTTITRSNGETLNILGGATGPLTDGNIGVFGIGNTLTIQLAENIDLGADGSLKTGDTLLDSSGVKITAINAANNVTLSNNGLNNGGNQITNVASGVGNNSNAANIGDLNNAVAANKTKYYSVNSTATGNANNDGATGPNAMAMGGNASATGGQAIAIGSGQSGQHTTASGQQSIAIGANVVSKGHSSIAIGGDDLDAASKANINGTSAFTINGGDVNATFVSYTGRDLVETPPYMVNTDSGGAASIAIGVKSLSEGALSTAIGVQSSSSGVASSAFGIGASASEKGSVALGAGAQSNTQEGVALGSQSVANVAGGAIGFAPTSASIADKAAITATNSTSLGAVSIGNAKDGTRQIVNVAAGINNSDAVNVSQLKALDTIVADIDFPIRSSSSQPYTTSVTGTNALAVGSNANANGSNSTVVGENAFGNSNSTVIGEGARSSFNGFAGGQDAKAGVNSIAIGQRATNGTSASRAVAIGYEAKATANDSVALGLDAQAQALGGVALGKGSRANALNSVALGQNSIATVQSGASFLTNVAADANNGTVSVGAVESERRIINVAGGSADTDAVNVSQLKAVTDIANEGWNISAQGNSATASNVGLSDSVDFNSKNNNITVSKDSTSNDVSFELNNNLDLGNNGSVSIGNIFGGTQVNRLGMITGGLAMGGVTTVSGIGVTVTGTNPLSNATLTSDGLSMVNGPSITKSNGINAGNKKVTNVKAGVLDKDAVNVGQLNSASAAAKTEVAAGTNVADVAKSTGQNGQDVYTVNADGVTASAGSTAVTVTAGDKDTATNMTDYAVDLSADSKASLVKADSAMQTVITQIDGNEVKTLDKTNNTANFLTGDNIVLSAEDGGIKVATAENVTFTSVTAGDTLLNTGGVSFLGGNTVRLSSMGLNNGGNRITEVADGEDDTDAVNIRQLNATNSTVDLGLDFTGDDTTVVVNRKLGQTLTIQGGATELTDNNIGVVADEEGNLNVKLAEDVMLGKNGSVRMESTVLNNAGVTITDGPNQTITLSNEGLDNGNNRIIKVGEGIAPTDAVNFAQLTTTNNEIAKGIKIGDGNSDNDQQFALGDTINVTGDSNLTTVASATGVQVKLNNQLDLGDEGSMQIGNSIMNNAGFTFIDSGLGRTVTLSSRGLDNGGNIVRNVGRGELNSDAVNVGQLREVTIALDRGWDITAQGDIATQVRQGDAIDLNSRDGNIKVSRTLVNDVATFDASTGLRAAAIPANANDISFDLSPDITLNSVTTGDTTINDNGLTIAGGPSVTKSGIDAADTKITNVQNGEVAADSQDAVNGSQLYAQGSGISSIIGGNTVYNPENGTFINNDIGGTGQGNIDGAIASIRQGTIEINENVQVNTTNITSNTTDITTNTTNIATNTSNIATNTTNITTNTTNINTNTDRLDAGLNFGADSGDNIIKPVGDESVLSFTGGNNITTTAEGSSIKFDLNGNISVDSVTAGTTVINSNGITMQDGPSMTAQGLYAGNQRITGVADGIEATDAVNYSQLSALDSRLNSNMSDLGYRIDEVEDDANAGISAAMAMSALPQAYIAGKSLIGGGVSTYNGESAVAIGFSKLSNDGRWVIKVNGTADTQGNVGGAVGAGFHFD
ncbi:ESPR-type extended signal peptide-containing protein [Psychrobacter glaciei]|uniref:ESPR-type extended signal peptide-containing protein n=1 Tax=Psychrobacter glaciei TaxID=619771 RepID=UPI003F44B294